MVPLTRIEGWGQLLRVLQAMTKTPDFIFRASGTSLEGVKGRREEVRLILRTAIAPF